MTNIFESLAGHSNETTRYISKSNRIAYKAIGRLVLIPVIVALLGGYHIAHSVTQDEYSSYFFAGIWGLFILILETGLLALYNPESKHKGLISIFRIGISIPMSMLLAVPFVLMLFNPTITQKLAEDKKIQLTNEDSLYSQNINRLKSQVDSAYQDYSMKKQITIEEAEGRSVIRLKGTGPIYDLKKEASDSAFANYNRLKIANDSLITQQATSYSSNVKDIEKYYAQDMLAQIKALYALSMNDYVILFFTCLVFFVLLLLDIISIIMKTMSMPGSPDDPYYKTKKEQEQAHLRMAMSDIKKMESDHNARLAPANTHDYTQHNNSFTIKARESAKLLNTYEKFSALYDNHLGYNEQIRQKAQNHLNMLLSIEFNALMSNSVEKPDGAYTLPSGFTSLIGDETMIPKYNPFACNQDMRNLVSALCSGSSNDVDKFNIIFDWMLNNIEYGTEKRGSSGYRTAIETYYSRQGVCGEMTALLVAMLRNAGIKAYYTHVSVDNGGKEVSHACATVYIDGISRLADVAYKNPDVKHVSFEVESDRDVLTKYRSWRNEKN